MTYCDNGVHFLHWFTWDRILQHCGGQEGEARVTLIALVPDRDNVLVIKIEESLTSIFSFWLASKKGNLILYDAWCE